MVASVCVHNCVGDGPRERTANEDFGGHAASRKNSFKTNDRLPPIKRIATATEATTDAARKLIDTLPRDRENFCNDKIQFLFSVKCMLLSKRYVLKKYHIIDHPEYIESSILAQNTRSLPEDISKIYPLKVVSSPKVV